MNPDWWQYQQQLEQQEFEEEFCEKFLNKKEEDERTKQSNNAHAIPGAPD